MKINYLYKHEKTNKKITFVFLHGLGGNLYAWKDYFTLFNKRGYATLAIDLRGHGLSKRADNPNQYDLEIFANDVKKILDKEKIKDFVLVGHCFGGVIASIFQKKYKSAKALILISATSKAPTRLKIIEPILGLLNRFHDYLPEDKIINRTDYSQFVGTTDYDIHRIKSDLQNTGLHSYLATFYHLSRYDGTEDLKNIKVPTLIIAGKDDTVFYHDYALTLHELIPNSKLVEVPNANHIIILTHTALIADKINSFISKNHIK